MTRGEEALVATALRAISAMLADLRFELRREPPIDAKMMQEYLGTIQGKLGKLADALDAPVDS